MQTVERRRGPPECDQPDKTFLRKHHVGDGSNLRTVDEHAEPSIYTLIISDVSLDSAMSADPIHTVQATEAQPKIVQQIFGLRRGLCLEEVTREARRWLRARVS